MKVKGKIDISSIISIGNKYKKLVQNTEKRSRKLSKAFLPKQNDEIMRIEIKEVESFK